MTSWMVGRTSGVRVALSVSVVAVCKVGSSGIDVVIDLASPKILCFIAKVQILHMVYKKFLT